MNLLVNTSISFRPSLQNFVFRCEFIHFIFLFFYSTKMTTQIDTAMFIREANFAKQNETEVIKSLKSKQSVDSLCGPVEVPVKSNRGRKRKYATDEERILARRAQQKAYRERKKKELLELRALKAQLDSEAKNNTQESV